LRPRTTSRRLASSCAARGIFVAIGSIIAAIICGVVAAMKGRNPLGWGILGLFFSIITLIVIIVIPSKKS
jgi:Na+/melibiose symporter-like transporter